MSTQDQPHRRVRTRRIGALSTALLAICAALAATVPAGALAAPPTIKAVKPAQGSESGGTQVKIKGANLATATSVKFGSVEASYEAKPSGTLITAIAPPGVGTVNVTVTTPEGTTPAGPKDEFSYVAVGPPVVKSVTPKKSPVIGGKKFTVKGANFGGATAVDFGGKPATSFTVKSESLIVGVTPRGAGLVDVRVTTPEGTSAIEPGDEFEYLETGTIQVHEISPTQGPAVGGTEVTISGENFADVLSVQFGEDSVPFTALGEKEITAISPASTVEILHVTVTTFYGTTGDFYCHREEGCHESDRFRVVEPTVTGVSPSHGPTAGGTPVTVTGSGFAVGTTRTTLQVNKVPASDVECSSISTCTFLAPPGKAGAQFVKAFVESDDPGGQTSQENPEAVFTYE
jgi:hypothetical protein